MQRPASGAVRRPAVAIGLSLITLGVSLSASECLANIAPESAILIHVQPVSHTCETSITRCQDIVRTTEAQGPVEFLIFFYRASSWYGQHLCIRSLTADLTWPEAWSILEFDPCGGEGWIYPEEGPVHTLSLYWGGAAIPDPSGSIFLAARLVLDVQGPGRLDFANPVSNPVELTHLEGDVCYGTPFVTQATGVDAEAGMTCEYTMVPCAGHECCSPEFVERELLLSAPPGAVVTGDVEFGNGTFMDDLCDFAIDTRADWLEATAERVGTSWGAILKVTADATGLQPGMYETQIQLASQCYTRPVARCLTVVFTVDEAIGVEDASPPVRSVSWGSVKALYR